jgi:hypothetical protein
MAYGIYVPSSGADLSLYNTSLPMNATPSANYQAPAPITEATGGISGTNPGGSADLSSMGTIFSIGGAINSMIGTYFAAKSQKSALQFQADMSKVNARMAENQAQSIMAAGQANVASMTTRQGQQQGAQRAAMGANGGDLGSGSNAEVLASSKILAQIDKNTMDANTTRAAWGARTQSVNDQNQALITDATVSGISPASAAFSSALGSAGGVAKQWYRAYGGFN